MDPFDHGNGDPLGEPAYESGDAQESDGGRDEDARARYLGFAEVLRQGYGRDRFHGLHGQGYAEGEAGEYVGQSAEDEGAGEGDGSDLRQCDEDGEEGADVAERAGDLGEGLAVEGFRVVSLDFEEVGLCFSERAFHGCEIVGTP